MGGEQARSPHDEESYVSVVNLPVRAKRAGAEPLVWRRRLWKVQRFCSYSTKGPVGVALGLSIGAYVDSIEFNEDEKVEMSRCPGAKKGL